MGIPGLALAPGSASGTVLFPRRPFDWVQDRPDPVPAVPPAWWPPGEVELGPVRAVIVTGTPEVRGPRPDFPVVARIDADVLRDGEAVEVDGDRGEIRLDGVAETHVVTSFLERPDGRILLLQRSPRVGSFQGRWAGVSGFLEDPTPLGQAEREIREETGLDAADLKLQRQGAVVAARDGARVFLVHPFRFRVQRTDVRIDWEHTAFEWVLPDEIRRRSTVPKLDRVWAEVAPASDQNTNPPR